MEILVRWKLPHRGQSGCGRGKHNTSIDGLSEAALSIPAIDVVMDRQHEKAERRRVASAMVSQIRDKLTETQFRRLWMYYIDGMTVDEIGEKEGVSHQAASLSITTAIRKIKKIFLRNAENTLQKCPKKMMGEGTFSTKPFTER